MKLKDRVALRIKTLRKRRELTQEELAERIGRSADAVSQLERGLSLPSFETLEGLAEAFGVSIRDLFDVEGTEGGSEYRQELMTKMQDMMRKLSDKELSIAAQIVEIVASKTVARAK